MAEMANPVTTYRWNCRVHTELLQSVDLQRTRGLLAVERTQERSETGSWDLRPQLASALWLGLSWKWAWLPSQECQLRVPPEAWPGSSGPPWP